MRYLIGILLFSSYSISTVQAQSVGKIKIPDLNDKYSKLIMKAETGYNTVDYRELRFAFIESKQYQYKRQNINKFDSLREQLYKAIEDQKYTEVIKACNQLLSFDYTYLYAQKYLYQTYKIIGDSVNYRKYHEIESGLLKSIVAGGDGKTCETPWEAAQVYEEYFVLDMLGEKMNKQTITQCPKHICDEMNVTNEDGKSKIHFFDVTQKLVLQEKELQGK